MCSLKLLSTYHMPACDSNQCCHGSSQSEPPPAACCLGNNWLSGSLPSLLVQGATVNSSFSILWKLFNWPKQRNWLIIVRSGITNYVTSPSEHQSFNLLSWLHFRCQILALNDYVSLAGRGCSPWDPHSFPSLPQTGVLPYLASIALL